MNLIAHVLNLRTNFKERYRLHTDASNQERRGIIDDYYQRLKGLLVGTPFEISPPCFANTISFTKYFADTLDSVPKSMAADDYHRLLYVFGVISLELMDEIKEYRLPIPEGDAHHDDYSPSLVHAISGFHRLQERSDKDYRFLSLTIEDDPGRVAISYVDAAHFRAFLARAATKEGVR